MFLHQAAAAAPPLHDCPLSETLSSASPHDYHVNALACHDFDGPPGHT
jgi:hypothetical protein